MSIEYPFLCIVDEKAIYYHKFLNKQWPGCYIPTLTIPGGEEIKTLSYASKVWQFLTEHHAMRNTTLVCVGGGATTDLGGFCASTFKRGIPHINVPTTLLAAVDASIGGKTGIDICGLKNQIGTFAMPERIITDPEFLSTLPDREILSGYAEALKTGIIAGGRLYADISNYGSDILVNRDKIYGMISQLAGVKIEIVKIDPKECGIRKILNLGHTAGHALESFSYSHNRPISHGHAVMAGMIIDSIIAALTHQVDKDITPILTSIYKKNYTAIPFSCDDYSELIALMKQDKKNASGGVITFILPVSPGHCEPCAISEYETIRTALDIYRDLVGI